MTLRPCIFSSKQNMAQKINAVLHNFVDENHVSSSGEDDCRSVESDIGLMKLFTMPSVCKYAKKNAVIQALQATVLTAAKPPAAAEPIVQPKTKQLFIASFFRPNDNPPFHSVFQNAISVQQPGVFVCTLSKDQGFSVFQGVRYGGEVRSKRGGGLVAWQTRWERWFCMRIMPLMGILTGRKVRAQAIQRCCRFENICMIISRAGFSSLIRFGSV